MEEPLTTDATHVVPSIESPPDVSTKQPEPENPPKVLTPPASEEEMDKRHGSSSDLSDIELDDEEDIGEIEPDHYFDGGRIPVFKPVSTHTQRRGAWHARKAGHARGRPMLIRDAMLTCASHKSRPWSSFAASRSSATRSISTA